jgi:hypothetical protein
MKRTAIKRSETPFRRSAMQARKPEPDDDAETVSEEYLAMVRELRKRARDQCEASVQGYCGGDGQHAHHRLLRSQGGPDDIANMLWLCFACHRWWHDHRADARVAKVIISRAVAKKEGIIG